MDAFYASVEQRDFPELRGKPIVVGGSPRGRGVVATASYEARAFGIHSAMPCAQAERQCPNLLFVPPRFEVYRGVSSSIHRIFKRYTDHVEPLALDEAYLDVTENKLKIPFASRVAREILAAIHEELNLTASAGVASTKFVAKIASGFRKPNGLVVVQPHEVLDFISVLDVGELWGVGPSTAEKLRDLGAQTIGDVRHLSRIQLEQALGAMGRFVAELASGKDTRSVHSSRIPRSRGAEITFRENVNDIEELKFSLRDLSGQVARALIQVGRPARTLSVKVRYSDFETVGRSLTLAIPTWDAEEIWSHAKDLLEKTEAGSRPVRLVGVAASNLNRKGDIRQLELPLENRS